jgi:hypothetical protein
METGNILIFQPGAGTINFVILYAECRYAECRYAECLGAVFVSDYFVKIFHKMLYPNLGL